MVEQPMETAVDPELPSIDETLLRQLVHQKLQELRHGDLFMDGLGEECYPSLLTNEKYYDVFTNILGAAWMNIHLGINVEQGLNGGKMKRKRKKFVKAIRQARDFVRPEIEYYKSLKHTPRVVESNEQNKDQMQDEMQADVQSSPKVKETPPHEIADTADSNEMDDVSSINTHSTSRHSKSSSKRKKKKSKKVKKKNRKEKRKYSKKVKNRKKRNKSNDSDDENSRLVSPIFNGEDRDDLGSDEDDSVPVHYTKAQAKEEFEKTKAQILRDVPTKVSKQFRGLGFCKWSKEWLPCLQLSPYDVSPGGVRQSWMEMFGNCKLSGRPLTRLIFWYGTATDSMGDAYSFLQEKHLITFEEGCSKGYHQIPSKVAKKLESKRKLTKNEEQHMRGLEEIKKEENRKPEDRINWLEKWQEDYELITDREDVDLTDDDSLSKVSKKPSPLKKKKPGKRKLTAEIGDIEDTLKKKAKISSVQHNLIQQKEGEMKPKKKKKSKKKAVEEENIDKKVKVKKSKKIKKSLADEAPSIKLEDSDLDVPKKKKLGSKKRVKERKKGDHDHDKNIQMELEQKENLKGGIVKKEVLSDDDIDGGGSIVAAACSDKDLHHENGDDTKKSKPLIESIDKKKHEHMTENDQEVDSEETLKKEKRLKDFHRREKLKKEKCEKEGLPYEHREYKPKGKKKSGVIKKSDEIKDGHSKQQQSLNACEHTFKPLMEDLDRANSSGDASLAMHILQQILNNVEIITPLFVRATKIGLLIKKTRKKIGGNHPEVEKKCREVTSDLKRVFAEKEKSVPPSIIPKVKKPILGKEKLLEGSEIKKEQPEVTSGDIYGTVLKMKTEVSMTGVKVKEEMNSNDSELRNSDQFTPDLSLKTPVKEEHFTQPIDTIIAKKESRTPLVKAVKIEMVDTPRPEKSKPERKSFSLRGMFEKPKKAPTSIEKSLDRSITCSPMRNQIPLWLTDSAKIPTISEDNSDRNLGLEVLSEAIKFFPAAKINKVSVARALEAAVYKWSDSLSWSQRGTNYNKSSMRAYWEKIDDVVAALSGNSKAGSIVQRIIDGNFSTAEDFIKLPRKTLYQSFMGKPII